MGRYFVFRNRRYDRLSSRCYTRTRRILFRHPWGGVVGKQDTQFLCLLAYNRKIHKDIDKILVVVDGNSLKRSFSIVWKDGSIEGFLVSLFLKPLSPQDGSTSYTQYLLSDAWQLKRLQVFERDGWVCVFCHERASHVHHKTYKNLGNEPLNDLETVCRSCHQEIHGKSLNCR